MTSTMILAKSRAIFCSAVLVLATTTNFAIAEPIDDYRSALSDAIGACKDGYKGTRSRLCEGTCQKALNAIKDVKSISVLPFKAKLSIGNCSSILSQSDTPPKEFTRVITFFESDREPKPSTAVAQESDTASEPAKPVELPTYNEDMQAVAELIHPNAVEAFTFAEARDRVRATGLYHVLKEKAATHTGQSTAELRQQLDNLHSQGKGKSNEAYALAGEAARIEYLAVLNGECSPALLKTYQKAGGWPIKPPRPSDSGRPPIEQVLPAGFLLRICMENEATAALSTMPKSEAEQAYDTSVYIPLAPQRYNSPIMPVTQWVPKYAAMQSGAVSGGQSAQSQNGLPAQSAKPSVHILTPQEAWTTYPIPTPFDFGVQESQRLGNLVDALVRRSPKQADPQIAEKYRSLSDQCRRVTLNYNPRTFQGADQFFGGMHRCLLQGAELMPQNVQQQMLQLVGAYGHGWKNHRVASQWAKYRLPSGSRLIDADMPQRPYQPNRAFFAQMYRYFEKHDATGSFGKGNCALPPLEQIPFNRVYGDEGIAPVLQRMTRCSVELRQKNGVNAYGSLRGMLTELYHYARTGD